MKSILERQKQESAKDYVLRVLIHNIVNTELVPGERLIDQEICGQLGVSRTPFREAELELAQKKLVDIRPKIGTYVSYIDSGLVEEIRHLRSVLEAELASYGCDLLSKDDIDKLWENIALWQLVRNRCLRAGWRCSGGRKSNRLGLWYFPLPVSMPQLFLLHLPDGVPT